jgi:hypothetical protein
MLETTFAEALTPELTVEGDSASFKFVMICCMTDSADVPVDVPVELVTAAAWSARPVGLVFCFGGVNGVSVVAAADEPA